MQRTQPQLTKATYIKLNSSQGHHYELSQLLIKDADIIKRTEPETKIWAALKENDKTYGIFDVFLDESGRTKHFAGQVAASLKENSNKLIVDGWETGIKKNIKNYDILSYKSSQEVGKSTQASYIIFTGTSDKERALDSVLESALQIVNTKESETLFWAALKLGDNVYAIFSTFPNVSSRKAHFEGEVVSMLHDKADELIMDGWTEGVLPNIHHLNILKIVVS